MSAVSHAFFIVITRDALSRVDNTVLSVSEAIKGRQTRRTTRRWKCEHMAYIVPRSHTLIADWHGLSMEMIRIHYKNEIFTQLLNKVEIYRECIATTTGECREST